MKFVRMFGLAAAVAVLVAGCASQAPSGGADRPVSTSAGNAQGAFEALRFTATTVDGADFSGESLSGKPAVLWFWAAWCAICAREAPTVATAAEDNAGVGFVGVAALSDVPDMRKFISDNGVGSITNIADTDGSVWERFGVTSQPAFAFVSADGTVETVPGSLSADELAERVRQLTES